VVGLCSTRGQVAFTDGALKAAGGASSYDELSYNTYYGSLGGGPISDGAEDAACFDAFESKYGHVTPHWVTESAPTDGVQSFYWPVGIESETRIQYAETIRFDVSQIGHGAKHVFYYSLHSNPTYGAYT
jgi:hypothetical protein